MAERVLYVSWGQPVRGAEERGLEVFGDTLGLMGRMQQEGRIESFDVVLLEPNGGVNGFVLVRGTAEQITALRADDGFRRSSAQASLIVDDLRHIEGFTNEGVAREMAMYQEELAKVPQRT